MTSYKLVTCPYDEAHKMKESRLQIHLTKCRMNHLDEKKWTCPFNAAHVLPIPEKDYHLLHCLDRAPLDRQLAQQNMERNNPFRGRTAVPSYTESMPVISDEVWDTDFDPPVAGYIPPSDTMPGGIMDPPEMSKPAERRRLYQELHRQPTEGDVQRNILKAESPTNTPSIPRIPKQPSEPPQLIQNVQNYQSLGLGRGKPPTARIAANIFPADVNSTGVSYSAIVNGINQLGLGRGQISRPVTAPIYDDDDDFPALGFGRGVHRQPLNSSRPGPRTPK